MNNISKIGTKIVFKAVIYWRCPTSLVTQAGTTLVNNKGDVNKTLKDLGKSQTAKNMVRAVLTVGATASLDKFLAQTLQVDTSATATIGDKFTRAFVQGAGHALTDSLIYGESLEESLKRHLTNQLVDAAAAGIYTHGVKPLDFNDTELISNVAHKLAAGLTGCLSAKAKDQSCEAAAVGAIIGEMVGDWMSNAHEVTLPDSERILILSDHDKQKILNTAKLAAGGFALLYGFDVDTAANEAGAAVENNALKQSDINILLQSFACEKQGLCDPYEQTIKVGMSFADMAGRNYQQLSNCYKTRGSSCYDEFRKQYSNVNYQSLYSKFRRYPEIFNTIQGIEERQKTLLSCYDVSPDQCLIQANFIDNTLSSINPFKGIRIKLEAITGKVASNTKPKAISTQRSTSLNTAIYTPRDQEVRELFTATNPRVSIRIGNRTLLPEPNSQGLTRIFNGASDAEVKKYFTELTGKPLPNPTEIVGKGVVYSVTTTDGKKYNLRNFASSSNITGPAWTIDIPKGVANPNKAT